VLDLSSRLQALETRQQAQATGDGWNVAPIPADCEPSGAALKYWIGQPLRAAGELGQTISWPIRISQKLAGNDDRCPPVT